MSIKIGAVINANEISLDNLRLLKSSGFNTINIFFWETLGDINLINLSKIVEKSRMNVDCLSIFGNPLRDDSKGQEIRKAWSSLIECSKNFDSPFVSGFAGRKCGSSVVDSIPEYKDFFSRMLDLSYKNELDSILFENCRMGDTWKTGKWNIAINPDAWQMMFESLDDEKLALQWEPCHQIGAFIDPIQQLEKWMYKIKHIHGKDGSIDFKLLKTSGLYGKDKFFNYTLPGEGDTDWKNIFKILAKNNFKSSVDIEFQGESFISNILRAKKSLEYLNNSKSDF